MVIKRQKMIQKMIKVVIKKNNQKIQIKKTKMAKREIIIQKKMLMTKTVVKVAKVEALMTKKGTIKVAIIQKTPNKRN